MGESLCGKIKENYVKVILQCDFIQFDELIFSFGMCRFKRDNFIYLEDIILFIYLLVFVIIFLCL